MPPNKLMPAYCGLRPLHTAEFRRGHQIRISEKINENETKMYSLKQIIILTIVSLFLSGGGIFIPATHKLWPR